MAMDQQGFVQVKSGQSWSSVCDPVVKDRQRVCLTRVSVVDPASAAGQGVVVARVKSDTSWNLPIAHLSAASAGWDLRPELVLDGEFFLYVDRLEEDGDSAAAVDVRFDFYVLPLPAPETVDQQLSRRPWSVDLANGFTHRTVMKGRDRVCLTRVSLVDPARVAGQGVVGACVHTVTRDRSIAPLSAERPSVELRPALVLDKEVHLYLMRLGCRPAAGEVVVRFEGYILPGWPSETMEEELDDDVGEEVEVEEDYQYEEPVSSDSEYDDDGGEEEEEEDESDGEVDGQEDTASGARDDVMHRTNFVTEEQFVGGPEPPFAFTGRTAGFMRVAAVDQSQEDEEDKLILVLYRYTRFSTALDGAVEARGRTKEHRLRFIVPPAGDTARSLPWAGASLANFVYPGGHVRQELQELWSSLMAEVSVPPRAAHVEVLVDVGILGPADCTQDSMEWLRATLKGMLEQQWSTCHTGMELHLPEPVRCGHGDNEADDDGDDTDGAKRPAKRRRVVGAGEDCPVCLQLLEGDDLAAWPGCSKPHVFHGGCLELVLRKSDMCPLCRHRALADRRQGVRAVHQL